MYHIKTELRIIKYDKTINNPGAKKHYIPPEERRCLARLLAPRICVQKKIKHTARGATLPSAVFGAMYARARRSRASFLTSAVPTELRGYIYSIYIHIRIHM